MITGTSSNSAGNTNTSYEELANNSNQQQLIHLTNLIVYNYYKKFLFIREPQRKYGKTKVNDQKFEKIGRDIDEVGEIEVVSSTRKNFITVDLSGSDVMASSQMLEDLLVSDQYDYFEIDTQMSII